MRLGNVHRPVDYPARPCEQCGTDYKPGSKAAKYCSKACSRKAAKAREESWVQQCSGCGVTFRGRRLQSFCTQACSAKHNGRHGGRPSATARPPRREVRTTLPPTQRQYANALLADPCAYCGGPAATIDHIEPASRGGADEWENFAPACKACNTSKMTSPLLAFLLRRRVDAEMRALDAERDVLLSLLEPAAPWRRGR